MIVCQYSMGVDVMYKNTKGEVNKNTTKSHGTCKGGPRFSNKSIVTEIYAACVEQLIQSLIWTISVALMWLWKVCDLGNSFAKGPAPNYTFYLQPGAQFL